MSELTAERVDAAVAPHHRQAASGDAHQPERGGPGERRGQHPEDIDPAMEEVQGHQMAVRGVEMSCGAALIAAAEVLGRRRLTQAHVGLHRSRGGAQIGASRGTAPGSASASDGHAVGLS